MSVGASPWTEKGATLSDKSAIKEFKLSQQDIYAAMKAGKLQFKELSIYGQPCFKLIRKEVESLVQKKFGKAYLLASKNKKELARVNREIRSMKKKIKELELQKEKLESFQRL